MKFTKIISVGLGSLGLLILVISIVGMVSNSSMNRGFTSVLENEILIDELSMHLEINMLEARRSEKDFIMRRDVKYVEKHSANMQELFENAHKIDSISSALGKDFVGVKHDIDSIIINAELYQKQFSMLIEGYKNRGLTHEDGLQGNFRNSAHELMDKTKGDDIRTFLPGIGEELLQIRRSEKDYLLRLLPKYVDNLHKQTSALEKRFEESALDDATKANLIKLSKNYVKDFDALVAENTKIDEYIATMRQSIHKIEPLTEHLGELAGKSQHDKVNSVEKNAQNTLVFLTIISIIGIAIAIFVVLKLLSIVRHKLGAEPSELEKIAQEIARGNIHVDFDSFDSFANEGLYKEMRTMASEIQTSILLAEEISEGDISVESHFASEDDALGIALDKMTTSLNRVVAGIKTASNQLDQSAAQVSDASQVIAESATEQAATIEEITASMVEIEKSAGENAEHAKNTKEFATDAQSAATRGAEEMANLRKTMDEVVESSNQVVKIIKVIDDIAFQTNLLALNAAVEAARAGAHGKGFAVVADEVRNLAARSAKAAQETADLITASNQGATRGAEMTSQTAEAFESIVEKVSGMGELITAIAKGAVEQASAVREINSGIEQLGVAIQNNSATSEETASASEEMSAQAADLNGLIRFFKVSEDASFTPAAITEKVISRDMPRDTLTLPEPDGSQVLSFDQSPLEY